MRTGHCPTDTGPAGLQVLSRDVGGGCCLLLEIARPHRLSLRPAQSLLPTLPLRTGLGPRGPAFPTRDSTRPAGEPTKLPWFGPRPAKVMEPLIARECGKKDQEPTLSRPRAGGSQLRVHFLRHHGGALSSSPLCLLARGPDGHCLWARRGRAGSAWLLLSQAW